MTRKIFELKVNTHNLTDDENSNGITCLENLLTTVILDNVKDRVSDSYVASQLGRLSLLPSVG